VRFGQSGVIVVLRTTASVRTGVSVLAFNVANTNDTGFCSCSLNDQ